MLRCEECERSEEEARRWRAYLTVIEEDEPEEVVVLLPRLCQARVRSDNG
jgi:hypothetical protein